MRKIILVTLICLTFFSAFTQQLLPEFGKIDKSDLLLKQCSFEPGATAMKFFDVQDVEFDYWGYGGRVEIRKRVRIKIFDKDGYKHASIRIPYNTKSGVSKIKSLKGVVYSLEESGEITTTHLAEEDIFKKKSSDHIGVIIFTFPNLKPGSVVEYSYTKIVTVPQLEPWLIQDEIPIAFARYAIELPVEAGIMHRTYGLDSVNYKRDDLRAKWQRKIFYKENVPSFHDEAYMSSFNDNLYRIAFMFLPRGGYMSDNIHTQKSADAIWKFNGSSLLKQEMFGGQMRVTRIIFLIWQLDWFQI